MKAIHTDKVRNHTTTQQEERQNVSATDGLLNSSLPQSDLRDSTRRDLHDSRLLSHHLQLTSPAAQLKPQQPPDRNGPQASEILTQARLLAQEEGLNRARRATGGTGEQPPDLQARLKGRVERAQFEQLKTDPQFAATLEQTRRKGAEEGTKRWTVAVDDASRLYNAMKGWSTDEAAIFKTLESKHPADIAATRDAFKDLYGQDLDAWLNSELSGSDLHRAQTLMRGDDTASAAAELYWSMKGAGTDEAAINRILSRPDAREIETIFNQQFAEKYGAHDLREALKTELGGDRLLQAESLLAMHGSAQHPNFQAKAAAAELHYALKGGIGVGTDEATLLRVLESSLKSGTLEQVKQAYRQEYGIDLETHVKAELSFSDQERALQLLSGDKIGADATALRSAEWGWGVDRSHMRVVLEGASDAHRHQVLARYQQQYGRDFISSVSGQANADSLKVIESLVKNGKLTETEELVDAMNGLGTSEEQLLDQLRDKSTEEISRIRDDYRRLTGRELDRDINWEVSGSFQFDATEALRGTPVSADEIHQSLERRYAYERSGIDLLTDVWSEQGRVLDRQMDIVRKRMDRIHNGTTTEEDLEGMQVSRQVVNAQAKNLRAAKDMIVDNAATVATVAVATGTVIASGGFALGFWATAGAATAGAAATRVGTKVSLKGARYDWGGELASDVGISALEAGTAKLGAVVTQSLAKTNLMARLGTKGMQGRMLSAAIDGAADGTSSGLISGIGETALTTDFSGMSTTQAFETVTARGTIAALGGGLGGGLVSAGMTGGLDTLGRSRFPSDFTDDVQRETRDFRQREVRNTGSEPASDFRTAQTTRPALTEQLHRMTTALQREIEMGQINSDHISEMLARLPVEERDAGKVVLDYLTHFGGVDSMEAIADNPLLKSRAIYTPQNGSLGDILNYLGIEKKSFPKMQFVGKSVEGNQGLAVILDDATLSRLKTDTSLQRLVADEHTILIHPRGFDSRAGMFATGPEMIENQMNTMVNLLKSQNVDLRNPAAVHEALAHNLDDALNTTLAEVARKLDVPVEQLIRNENGSRLFMVPPPQQMPGGFDAEIIAQRLRGPEREAQKLQEILSKNLSELPSRQRELLAAYIDEMAQIHDFRSLSRLAHDQGAQVQALIQRHGLDPEKVFFLTPEGGKSYDMAAMVQRMSGNVPPERVINFEQLKANTELFEAADSMVIIADDFAGTGNSLAQEYFKLRTTGWNGKVCVAPLLITARAMTEGVPAGTPVRPGAIAFTGFDNLMTQDPDLHVVFGRVIKDFSESNFAQEQLLDSLEQEAFREIVLKDNLGFGEYGLLVAFPYMSPNNNAVDSFREIVGHFTHNGAGVKGYKNRVKQ